MIHLLLQSSFVSDKNMPWLIIGGGVFLITYLVIRPFLRRKKDPMDAPARYGRPLSQQRTVEKQMESLLVELSEMTRQMSAQLDNRSAKLQILLAEADTKIAELKQANQLTPSAASPASDPYGEQEPTTPAAKTSQTNPDHDAIYALADQKMTIPEIAQQLHRPSGEIELILALRPR